MRKITARYDKLQILRSKGVLIASEEEELKEISTELLYKILEEPEISKIFKRMKDQDNYPDLSYEKIEKAFRILATTKFYNLNELKDFDSKVEKEIGRLERCVEHYYKLDKTECQYKEFAYNFILENFNEIVNGTEFNDLYLDSIKDSEILENDYIIYAQSSDILY
jgi:hypothetical protein